MIITSGTEPIEDYYRRLGGSSDCMPPSSIGVSAGTLAPGTIPFQCWATCPKCQNFNVHWLDNPRIATVEAQLEYRVAVEAWQRAPSVPVIMWGGEIVRHLGDVPFPGEPPVNETAYEVMRVCRECGHRWGMV